MSKAAHNTADAGRVRTVERDPGGGWIARSPFDGRELGGDGFRWNSRSVARTVVDEDRVLPSAALAAAKTEAA
jgi:hypothetical protein